jgi:hypothetical protein
MPSLRKARDYSEKQPALREKTHTQKTLRPGQVSFLVWRFKNRFQDGFTQTGPSHAQNALETGKKRIGHIYPGAYIVTSDSITTTGEYPPMRYRPLLLTSILVASCAQTALAEPKPAESFTAQKNVAVLEALPFANTQAFDDARRGFIAQWPDGKVIDSQGNVAWNMAAYAFLNGKTAPDTVNPSLWRQAQLNAIHGLFEVT